MLGTGIASADENVNPDAAPSAVDGGVAVPVDVEQNVVGNPIDQRQLPETHHEIDGDQVEAVVGTGERSPANPLVRETPRPQRDSGRLTSGDVVRGDVAVSRPDVAVVDDQRGDVLAVDADARALREAVTGGGVRTPDEDGTLSGDIFSGQWTAPVQVTDDGIAAVGNADSGSVVDPAAIVHGSYDTVEQGGEAAAALAPLIGFGGSAVEHGDGVASRVGDGVASRVGDGVASRVGDDPEGLIAGDVLSVSDAPAAHLLGDATGVGGRRDTPLDPVAGGDVETSGHRGSAAGNAAAGELTAPVQTFGDSAGVAVRSDATALNDSYLASGADTDTSLADAVASRGPAAVPVHTVAQVFSVPVALIGFADTYVDNHVGETDEIAGTHAEQDSRTATEKPIQVYGVPDDVLGTATAFGRGTVLRRTGEDVDARAVQSPDHGIQLPDSVDRLMTATELPSLAALDRLPSLSALPVPELSSLTGVLPLDAPQERSRSTRVSAPGVSGDVSTLSGVLPLSEERSTPAVTPGLRTLPVAAPVLPVVVPVAPIAQPRSVDATTVPELPPVQDLPALPELPGAASERTINAPVLPGLTELLPVAPVQDLLPALPALPVLPGAASERAINAPALPALTELLPVPQVPALPALPALPGVASQRSLDVPALPSLPGLPGERSFAPALSTLDTDSMLDTVQLPRI